MGQSTFTFDVYLKGQLIATVTIKDWNEPDARSAVREMFSISQQKTRPQVPHIDLRS